MGNKSKRPSSLAPVAKATFQHYSGPVPPASEMAKYEEILPGTANRILAMTEQQLQHRIAMESVAVQRNLADQRLGMYFAFFIAIASLATAAFCVYCGHEKVGALIGSSAIGSVVTAFIYGTRSNRVEREKKAEQIQRSQKQYLS